MTLQVDLKMPITVADLTLPALREAYKAGKLTPTTLCEELLVKIQSASCTFITKPNPKEVLERCRSVLITPNPPPIYNLSPPFHNPDHLTHPSSSSSGIWKLCLLTREAPCGGFLSPSKTTLTLLVFPQPALAPTFPTTPKPTLPLFKF